MSLVILCEKQQISREVHIARIKRREGKVFVLTFDHVGKSAAFTVSHRRAAPLCCAPVVGSGRSAAYYQ